MQRALSSIFFPSRYLFFITKCSQTESCKWHSHINAHPNSHPFFLRCSFISLLCIPLSLFSVFYIGLCRSTQNSLYPTALYVYVPLSIFLTLSPFTSHFLTYCLHPLYIQSHKERTDIGIQGIYVNPVDISCIC